MPWVMRTAFGSCGPCLGSCGPCVGSCGPRLGHADHALGHADRVWVIRTMFGSSGPCLGHADRVQVRLICGFSVSGMVRNWGQARRKDF
ncbi:MAG: hypothetical protein GY940_41010 [bacterium]|nr:hypothetical protein [bacterium]